MDTAPGSRHFRSPQPARSASLVDAEADSKGICRPASAFLVGAVRHAVPMPGPSLRDVTDRLFAAEQDASAYHHDLCGQASGDECSCGAPRLWRDVAAVWRQLGLGATAVHWSRTDDAG